MKQIHWAKMPLRQEAHRMAGIINPMYEAALKKPLTKKLFQELKIIAVSKQNLIMLWFGLPGSGKSFSLLFIVEKYLELFQPSKKLNIKYCYFTISDLLRDLETIPKGSVVILDEQIHTSGYGSRLEKNALENIERTVRAHKLSFFFAAPVYIRHNYFYACEAWEMGSTEKWDWNKPIEKQWKYTKVIIYSHKHHQLGYIITGAPKDKKFLELYEDKKDKFIKDVRRIRGSKRYLFILEQAEILCKSTKFLKEFTILKTKRLKLLSCNVHLEAPLISIDEQKTLVDLVEYKIFTDKKLEKWKKKMEKKPKKKKTKKKKVKKKK